jgi:hypothetical protein
MNVAGSGIAQKDVIVSVVAASTALAGLILVSLSWSVANFQSYSAETPAKVKTKIRNRMWPTLWVFVFSVLVATLSSLWLVIPGGDVFYWVCVVTFLADLLAIVIVTVESTMDLLA